MDLFDDTPRLDVTAFLDVLFSAIGIFVILMVLQSVKGRIEAGSEAVDALLLCRGHRLHWLQNPGDQPERLSFGDLGDKVRRLAEEQGRNVNLLLAFDADGLYCRASAQEKLQALGRIDAKQTKDADNKPGFRVMLQPLKRDPDAGQALIRRWAGEPPAATDHGDPQP